MPPQNLSLWHIDYFEPKAIEKQQMKKGFLIPPPFYLKADRKISMCQEENILITREWESMPKWI